MLRLALAGFGFVAAIGAGVFIVPAMMSSPDPVEVASLNPDAGLEQLHEPSAFSKVVGILPFVGEGEPPMTRPRALAHRQELRSRELRSFLPEAPEGWSRIEWHAFFEGKFGPVDGAADVLQESYVYLKDDYAVYMRIQHSHPTGPMIADLLQIQRYVEKGGDLGDLEGYRATVEHSLASLRSMSDGWSVGPNFKFWHSDIVQGASFIAGKFDQKPNDFKSMRLYHAELGSGAVIKVRADAPKATVMELIQQIDFDSLNHMQEVPHPLIGTGLPEFVIETPEEWLANNGFKLRKVERVIPVKEEPAEEVADEADESAEDAEDKDEKLIAKGGKDKK
jgi:hypothetical protein